MQNWCQISVLCKFSFIPVSINQSKFIFQVITEKNYNVINVVALERLPQKQILIGLRACWVLLECANCSDSQTTTQVAGRLNVFIEFCFVNLSNTGKEVESVLERGDGWLLLTCTSHVHSCYLLHRQCRLLMLLICLTVWEHGEWPAAPGGRPVASGSGEEISEEEIHGYSCQSWRSLDICYTIHQGTEATWGNIGWRSCMYLWRAALLSIIQALLYIFALCCSFTNYIPVVL